VGGEGVQQALLKMLEGSQVFVPERSVGGPGGKRARSMGDTIPVDTSNILFVSSGAFPGIERLVTRRLERKSMGFNLNKTTANHAHAKAHPLAHIDHSLADYEREMKERDALLKQVEAPDLVEFGFLPEFAGRFPVIVPFHSLDEGLLVRVLTEPRNSLISQYSTLFGLDDIELEVTPDALQVIARQALRFKTGARALRSILERSLTDAMFELPGRGEEIARVSITPDVVLGKCSPIFVPRQQTSATGDARATGNSSAAQSAQRETPRPMELRSP
jgi:ATP-dependent Clp protease ATP-binding subunit ClpX